MPRDYDKVKPDDPSSKRTGSKSTDSGSEQEESGNQPVAILEQPKKKPQGEIRAGLRSLYCDKTVRVKFVNHSGKEVQLYWINYVGECEKAFKLAPTSFPESLLLFDKLTPSVYHKGEEALGARLSLQSQILDGKCEVIDTYETHPWIAANARNRKVHHAFTIANNLVYYPMLGPNGGKYTVAEIRKAPEKLADLASKASPVEVMVKFINRTTRPAYLEMVNSEGDRELKYTLAAGQSWTAVTQEKTYWITTMNKDTDEGLLLNYGWYYSPNKTRMKKERCYITDYI